MPIHLVDLFYYGTCWYIWHTWILWVCIVGSQRFIGLVGWLKRGMCHPANDSGTECQEKNLMMFLAINTIYMYYIILYMIYVKLCAVEIIWNLLIFVRGRGSRVTEEGRPGIFNGLISLISCICHLFPEPKLKQVQLMAVPRQQSQRECSGRFLTPLGIFPLFFMSWMILMVDTDVNQIILS